MEKEDRLNEMTLVPYFSVDNSDLKTILLVLFYLQFRHYKVHCDLTFNKTLGIVFM